MMSPQAIRQELNEKLNRYLNAETVNLKPNELAANMISLASFHLNERVTAGDIAAYSGLNITHTEGKWRAEVKVVMPAEIEHVQVGFNVFKESPKRTLELVERELQDMRDLFDEFVARVAGHLPPHLEACSESPDDVEMAVGEMANSYEGEVESRKATISTVEKAIGMDLGEDYDPLRPGKVMSKLRELKDKADNFDSFVESVNRRLPVQRNPATPLRVLASLEELVKRYTNMISFLPIRAADVNDFEMTQGGSSAFHHFTLKGFAPPGRMQSIMELVRSNKNNLDVPRTNALHPHHVLFNVKRISTWEAMQEAGGYTRLKIDIQVPNHDFQAMRPALEDNREVKTFDPKLLELAQERKLTTEHLMKGLGVSEDMLTGPTEFATVSLLEKVAAEYGIPTRYLTGENGEPNPAWEKFITEKHQKMKGSSHAPVKTTQIPLATVAQSLSHHEFYKGMLGISYDMHPACACTADRIYNAMQEQYECSECHEPYISVHKDYSAMEDAVTVLRAKLIEFVDPSIVDGLLLQPLVNVIGQEWFEMLVEHTDDLLNTTKVTVKD